MKYFIQEIERSTKSFSGIPKKIDGNFGKDYFNVYPYKRYGYVPSRCREKLNEIETVLEKSIQGHKILDAGCGRGSLVKYLLTQGIDAVGIDMSSYAVEHSVCDAVLLGDVVNLSRFGTKSFDVAICNGVLNYLKKDEIKVALDELDRVAHKSFITVVTYRDDKEKVNMIKHQPTLKTTVGIKAWKLITRKYSDNGHLILNVIKRTRDRDGYGGIIPL